MDMFKEDWHWRVQNYFLPRGLAAMTIDGPGQGETLVKGQKVTIDNYERAGKTIIDYLVKRPEVDPDKICLYGFSMASYWGNRIAAYDHRLKACATAMGCYVLDDMDIIFNLAQPSFKLNFMYMAGITDEAEFDRKITKHMGLRNIAPQVECPTLMVYGEFDELSSHEDSLAVYDLLKVPKAFWVYEEQFHPLAGVARECFASMTDWLLKILNGEYESNMDDRRYIKLDGTHVKGTAKPPWWGI